jgi:hypothetical protein
VNGQIYVRRLFGWKTTGCATSLKCLPNYSSKNYNEMLAKKIIEIAASQVGQCEKPKGSNWGEPVQSYLKSVGITFPAAWCMAFVYWTFQKACAQLSVANNLIKTGGVLDAWNRVDKKYKSEIPVVGSVFIMQFSGGRGHTGIVESYDARFIYTIEGNTNDEGSREGYEVAKKKRLRSQIKGYINIF